jgi:hypothetical protein
MNVIDPRLMEIQIIIGAKSYRFQGNFALRAVGTLFANPFSDVCDVTIFNMDRATQDYLLNVTSPYSTNRDVKTVRVYAGRQSYGMSLIYEGGVLVSRVSQPPDIGVTFSCSSGLQFQNTIYSVNNGVSQISKSIQLLAERLNARPRIELANDVIVKNYRHDGTAITEMAYMNTFGNFTVFYNQGSGFLVVKDAAVALRGTLRIVSEATGMIGIPEWTELGVKVTFLIDSKTQIGGEIQIKSNRYPAFNGNYAIYKLGFDLASRERPFYYIAEAARRLARGEGGIQ